MLLRYKPHKYDRLLHSYPRSQPELTNMFKSTWLSIGAAVCILCTAKKEFDEQE